MLATTFPPLAFFGPLGPTEMLVVVAIALLVFGKDLPDVAKQWGKTFNEFRRHLNSVRSDLNDAIYAEPERPRLQHHPEFHRREETKPVVLEQPSSSTPSTPAAGEAGPAATPSD
jgi:sec-independent protein translocase protein TatA